PYSTISSVAESPLKFGLIYVGTDDGHVQVFRQHGWRNITAGLPRKWVSNISPSIHKEGEVLVTLNGYREDDFQTYIYRSEDYGDNWPSLKGNLPDAVANVSIEDPVNPKLLYLGTDNGAYISFDRGLNWQLISGIPNVACYDMIVHPRDNELVVATHGRGIYIIDVKPVQNLKNPEAVLHTYKLGSIKYNEKWGEARFPYLKPRQPETTWTYYLGQPSSKVMVTIHDGQGNLLRTLNGNGEPGFHHLKWDLRKEVIKKKKVVDTGFVSPGTYKITFASGSVRQEQQFSVKE
ncbi:MAG: glycosyl hydrolase, partial [Cyclobacteriaceae bacterium]